MAQAERIATGAPAWFLREAIVNNTRRDLTAAVQNEDGSATVMLAVDERDNRLGFVFALAAEMQSTGALNAHVSDIAVAAEAEGRGIGRVLLEAAEAWARSRGAATMSLHVFEANTRAQGLYARMGFEGESRRLAKPLLGDQ
jgi:ribosomal protein S18 acetylase RimI-like enzyme